MYPMRTTSFVGTLPQLGGDSPSPTATTSPDISNQTAGLSTPKVTRFLGGVVPPICQSCRIAIAVLSVQYPDFMIQVCYGCRP